MCVIIWKKKLPKQILDLATKGLTVSRNFKKIFNLSGHKNSCHTMNDLEREPTFQQAERDNCTPCEKD